MSAAIFAFAEGMEPAARLAEACELPLRAIACRRFPDGESLVTVPQAAETALLYRSLDDANARLVELLLAASALRDGGAQRVILIAPYLAYMRQDMAFHPGEAVSQRVIGRLLADWFDGVVTVDPHLHRIARLEEAIPGIPALALSAAPALVAALEGIDPATVIVGPDSESRPWVESIARPLGLDLLVGEKVRHGDREVTLAIPGIAAIRGRPALLVDDVVSSGTTLAACARLLLEAGAAKVNAVATHALASPKDRARLAAAGVESLRASDSIGGGSGAIPLAGVLAGALRERGWLD